jgi:hypothetical protein
MRKPILPMAMLLLGLFSNGNLAEAAALECPAITGTTVYYTNGIIASEDDAKDAKDAVKGLGLSQTIDPKGNVLYDVS